MKFKKITLSIGEPWDFESPDGQNILNGILIKKLDKDCIIFKSNHIISLQGIEGNMFVLTPRHKEADFNDSVIAKVITINGGIIIGDYHEGMSKEELYSSSKFVIIGSIKSID